MADVAYTNPPRDTRRKAIDATFSDMMRDAEQVQGSVFDTPKDRAIRDVISGGGPMGAGVLVPKFAAMGKGFTPAEMAAQRMWGKYWPKMLEAIKNDKRPGGRYILDLLNKQGIKGETEAVIDTTTGKLMEPITMRLNPKTVGMETGPHEAQHAFAYRRNPTGGGNIPSRGGFEVLDPEVQAAYKTLGGGDPAHAAVYYRADEAAKRMGLVPGRGASLRY